MNTERTEISAETHFANQFGQEPVDNLNREDFAIQFERKDGLRRLVLIGTWECDPMAATA